MSLSRKPALVAACLALAAGGGGAAVLATSASASTVTSARQAPAAHRAAAATGTGTVTLTGPKGKTATRTVPVSCKVIQGRYVVLAGKRRGHSGTSLRLSVKDYTGAGSYTANVLVTHHRRSAFSGHRYAKVPVTLTSTGGSFTVSKTLSGKHDSALKGKTISVSASWTCSV